MWKRVLVFLSSIPITIFMNSFRIGVIGYLVANYGQEQADGFLHYFEGWIIFMACAALLLLEMALLAKVGRNKRRLRDVFGLEFPKPLPAGIAYRARPLTPVHYGIMSSVVVIALSSLYIKVQDEVLPPRQAFASFPQQIGEWKGRDRLLEQIYLDSLQLDDYLMGDYANPKGDLVNFYVAYYASQQAGSAAHSPRSCIPGGGWKISELTQVSLEGIGPDGQPLRVNRLVIVRGEIKQLVYYWFQQRGRNIINEYLVKWYLFVDGLTRNRTDGGLVRLSTSVGLDETWEDGDRRLVEFAQQAVPMLYGYVPD